MVYEKSMISHIIFCKTSILCAIQSTLFFLFTDKTKGILMVFKYYVLSESGLKYNFSKMRLCCPMRFSNTTSDSGGYLCKNWNSLLYFQGIPRKEKITGISNFCISIVAQHSEAPSEIKVIYRLNKTSIISGSVKIK